MKLEERLVTLSKLNANTKFENKQLYRMLYSRDFFIYAYEKLKTNKGAMTSGIHPNSNVDGMSIHTIDQLITKLKDESYQPNSARRTYIPKANGKSRPLGIPCFEDKLVQKCVEVILTCIYDGDHQPTFSKYSYGFRPNLGCHNALKYMNTAFNGCIWIIKADVRAFFDEVNHQLLVKFLRKRIKDERFIRLIWKFLKCGFTEDGILHKPNKGTPQGGNLSPMLANIYLHEFDMFIRDLMQNMGCEMIANLQFQNIATQLRVAKKKLKESNQVIDKLYEQKRLRVENLTLQLSKLNSRVVANPNKANIRYVRYADDWIIGLKCTNAIAKDIYNKCKSFFEKDLHLQWNESKSILQRSTKKDVEFLGVYLSFVKERQVRSQYVNIKGKKFLKRVIYKNHLNFKMNPNDVYKKLYGKGFVNEKYEPTSNKKLVNLDVHEIARIYKTTLTGIANYYGFVHNAGVLNKIHYYLFVSLGKTLAHKFKTSKAQIYHKYGNRVLTFKGIGKAKDIIIPMYGGHTRNTWNFRTKIIMDDKVPLADIIKNRQSSWLNLDECCICNYKKQMPGEIEMHHVKHIRKMGKKVHGFTIAMRKLNRKQIPVCLDCHHKIHQGEYDGLNLNLVAKQIMHKLGIKKWEERELSPQELALMYAE
ncbi:MAG: reverse transcriptase domain-containing protein [Saprospiraceae bacterium]